MGALEGRTVLVTGASGFIGGATVRRLAAAGARVHATTRRDPPVIPEVSAWHRVDLLNPVATRDLVSQVRPEVVIHLAGHPVAARGPEQVLPSFQGNLVTTVNLLTAAAGTGPARVVLAGSLEEPAEGAATSPYALSKKAAGEYGELFHRLYGLPVVRCRIFMTYGPGQADLGKLIPSVALALLRGEAPRIASGSRLVDWIFVTDVADGLVAAAAASGLDGGVVDLGSGELVTVRDVVETLVELTGTGARPEYLSRPERQHEEVRAADTSGSKARFGWTPSITLRDGLTRTVEWCRQLGPAASSA